MPKFDARALQIREAVEDDAPRLARMDEELLLTADNPAFKQAVLQLSEWEWRETLSGRQQTARLYVASDALVAELGEEIVAVGHCRDYYPTADFRCCHISFIQVKRTIQTNGIGTRLLGELVDRAANRGCEVATLETDTNGGFRLGTCGGFRYPDGGDEFRRRHEMYRSLE